MKVCRVCQVSKPLSDFGPSVSHKSGLQTQCRPCQKASTAAYRAATREHISQRRKEYRAQNKERIAASLRENYLSNRPQRLADMKTRRSINKDAYRQSLIAWKKRNVERVRALGRNYYARKRNAEGSHTAQEIQNLFALQRGRCAACTKALPKSYHVDHKEPLALGGSNDPGNLQLLCKSCNCSKGAKPPEQFMQERGYLL